MNYERISATVDIDKMQAAHVVVIGGAYQLTSDLVRSGVGSISYMDFDTVSATNPARQDFNTTDIGQLKIDALGRQLLAINPGLIFRGYPNNFCALSREWIDTTLGDADLWIVAVDDFPATARANIEAARLNIPTLFIGVYQHGVAGEVIHHVAGVTPACYRCVASGRYEAFEQSQGRVNIPSSGATIQDLHMVDAVAGQIAMGILNRGSDNRFGKMIDQMGDRNLTQIKIDPDYRMGDKDIFAKYLGDHPANFSFTSICLPMEPEHDCPDCRLRRQHHGHTTNLQTD